MGFAQNIIGLTEYYILPRAEVPRDLDIVPLPPGTFYIKIELFFYSAFFQCILNKFRLHLYKRRMPNAVSSLLNVKCKIHRSISCGR